MKTGDCIWRLIDPIEAEKKAKAQKVEEQIDELQKGVSKKTKNKKPETEKFGKQLKWPKNPREWPNIKETPTEENSQTEKEESSPKEKKDHPIIYFHFLLSPQKHPEYFKNGDIAPLKGEGTPYVYIPKCKFTPEYLLYVGERSDAENLGERVNDYKWLKSIMWDHSTGQYKSEETYIFTHVIFLPDKPFGEKESNREKVWPRKTLEALVYLDLLDAFWKDDEALRCNNGMQFSRKSMRLENQVSLWRGRVLDNLAQYVNIVNGFRTNRPMPGCDGSL